VVGRGGKVRKKRVGGEILDEKHFPKDEGMNLRKGNTSGWHLLGQGREKKKYKPKERQKVGGGANLGQEPGSCAKPGSVKGGADGNGPLKGGKKDKKVVYGEKGKTRCHPRLVSPFYGANQSRVRNVCVVRETGKRGKISSKKIVKRTR